MRAIGRLTVQAGNHDHAICPVSAEIPVNYIAFGDPVAIAVQDARSGAFEPCQTAPARKGTQLTFLLKRLRAGETRKYRIIPQRVPFVDRVKLVNDEESGRLEVLVSGKPFTTYHYGPKWVRPFFQPLIGPGGVKMTRNWPVEKGIEGETRDHRHHKSLWVAYGECDTVDNWSEDKGHGYQRHRRFLSLVSGPVYGEFVAKLDWCNAKERKQFEETRRLRFYAVPGGARLFDVSISFRMTEREVTFRDTKEGGLISVRVASAMDVPRGGRIENGYGGCDEKETWGKKAPWCDYSGVVDGQHVGIAVMDHETNPRYPTEWHVRNYGLMTANCFGWSYFRPERKQRGDMRFRKGSATPWNYRIYMHKGDAGKAKVRERFLDYIAPPEVTVG